MGFSHNFLISTELKVVLFLNYRDCIAETREDADRYKYYKGAEVLIIAHNRSTLKISYIAVRG